MSDSATMQRDRLVADLKAVIADAEELLRVTAGQAGEGASELRERVQTRLAHARERLADLQHTAIEKARAAGHAADDFVHENPWKSIGLAACVGLVVGLLISRR
jgi:ElaB/YqjD/DUF883 family membrane-anchored ribosome-binding protein